jgi:hypothetical protein
MPSASEFKRAFALETGARVAGATVEAGAVGHEQLRRQELYRYSGEMTLKLPTRGRTPAPRALAAEFKRRVGEKMVYSSYGSPYWCWLKSVKVKALNTAARRATLVFEGRAERRRDAPTLAEVKARERAARCVRRVDAADESELVQSMRVITSRFGSSRCAACGDVIDPGERVARPADYGGHGGWAHAACAIADRKAARRGGGAARKGAAPARRAAPAPRAGTRARRPAQEE